MIHTFTQVTKELKRRANGSTITTLEMGNFFIECNFFLPVSTELLPSTKKDPSKTLLIKRVIVL
jgi:hypothetical protein